MEPIPLAWFACQVKLLEFEPISVTDGIPLLDWSYKKVPTGEYILLLGLPCNHVVRRSIYLAFHVINNHSILLTLLKWRDSLWNGLEISQILDKLYALYSRSANEMLTRPWHKGLTEENRKREQTQKRLCIEGSWHKVKARWVAQLWREKGTSLGYFYCHPRSLIISPPVKLQKSKI